jgi:hypothetical protein
MVSSIASTITAFKCSFEGAVDIYVDILLAGQDSGRQEQVSRIS